MKYSVMIASLLAVLLSAAGAQAAGAEGQCVQAKFKAQGKLKACLAKNAVSVLGGRDDAAAECRTAFQEALDAADAKATAAGTSCRFIDNGDQTISDLDTGLMWEKKSTTCPGPHCYTDTFTWSQDGLFPIEGPWYSDGTLWFNFLSSLNSTGGSPDGSATAGCFAEHCDWRIPTAAEASELDPYIQLDGVGGRTAPVFGVLPDGFWTLTADPTHPEVIVNVAPFSALYYRRTEPSGAIAVRGGF